MSEESKKLDEIDIKDEQINLIDDTQILKLEEEIVLHNTILFKKKQEIKQEIDKVYIRTKKDIENAYKFSLEKNINLILPIVDNLERALNLSNSDNNFDKNIIEKLKLTIKYFLEILDSFGVTVINTTNVSFNPDIHQAMSIQFSDNIPENSIVEILQNGYSLNNRLLRPAMVSVSMNKN